MVFRKTYFLRTRRFDTLTPLFISIWRQLSKREQKKVPMWLSFAIKPQPDLETT